MLQGKFALTVLKQLTESAESVATDTPSGSRSGASTKESVPMNLFVLRTWLETKFAKDEKGASMVEYILLVALIALAVIAAVVFLKDQVNNKFNDAGSKLSSSGS
jgi:pilus assembly protein Flp/PilA